MPSLREEINSRDQEVLALARWKLIAATSVIIVVLGWGDIKAAQETGPLILYLVGYLCLYIDLFIYRRLMLIHVLSRYLRDYKEKYKGKDKERIEEEKYERFIEEQRKKGVFIFSERWGHFISSLLITLGAVIIEIFQTGDWEQILKIGDKKLFLPTLALVLMVVQFIRLSRVRSLIRS